MKLASLLLNGLISDIAKKMAPEYYSYSAQFLECQTEEQWRMLFEESLRKIFIEEN